MRGVELGSHLVEFTVIHALLMVPHPYHFATRAGDLNELELMHILAENVHKFIKSV